MPPSIHVKSLETQGITLTSPVDQEFDSLTRSLFKGNADELLKAKPYLVIVANQSTRTLVAYTMCWEVKMPTGRNITRSQHKYPDAVAGAVPVRGNEIRPGEQKVAPMSMEINCGRWGREATEDFYLSQLVRRYEKFAGATDIQIGFHAVIFDDGELIGPDESQLRDHFAAYVEAKQDLYRSLVQSLDSGQSMDEAFRPIEATIAATLADPPPDLRNRLAIWPRQAAAELRMWRRRYGDAALPDIIRRAVRKEPFVIRRRDDP